MNHKDILKLRGVKDYFQDLSIEYYEKATNLNYSETRRARYMGRSHAYDIAAERIDRLIIECEKVNDDER